MKPVIHPSTNDVLAAPPGASVDEFQHLPITRVRFSNGAPAVWSYWQPSEQERALIAAGAPVRLSIIGTTLAPLHLGVDGDGL